MAVKYLDNAGTQYLVNKIKAIDGKIPTESQITTMITTALNTYKEGIVTIVESLPQTGEEGKLYLMVDPSDSDVYIIYTWEENAFKRMGSKTFTLTVDSALSSTSTNPVQNKVIKSALDGKANSSHTHGSITNDGKLGTSSRVVITGNDKKIGISTVTTTQLGYLRGVTSDIQTQLNSKSATGHTHTAGDVAGLATVATSGSYNDLSNKPTINDSTITIQKNGSTVDTFTTNGSNKTINIAVPTKTSDLTNDSNFVDTSNAAVSSGITSAKVTSYDSHVADTDIHVTTADKTKWNNGVSQSYVLRYSSSSVTDNSTIAFSTLDNTDNIKASDKIIDSDGKIFSIVSVDTANQTVTVGTALIDLAKDSDVVHKSGNETVGGEKTFNGLHIIGYGTQYKGARNAYILPEFSAGYSGLAITTLSFAQTLKIGNFVLDANNKPSLDTSKGYIQLATGANDGVNTCVLEPRNSTSSSLGASSNRWSKIYGTEYYYGANNVEFSTKFVTTDTNQTIAGQKLFDDINTISSSAEIGVSGGSNSFKILDKNKKTLLRLQGGTFSTGMAYSYWLVNNGSDVFNGVFLYQVSNNLAQLKPYDSTLSMQLGASNRYFSDCYTSKVNGLEPSTLSLPSDRSTRVDISGYFTNTANGDTNTYTVPANGWIYLNLNDVVVAHCFAQTTGNLSHYGQTFARASAGQLHCLFPVRKDDVFVSQWYTTTTVTVTNAYFIPCQGNI